MNHDLMDEDGYPTQEALDRLEHFTGSPKEFVEYATSIYSGYGAIAVEDVLNGWNYPVKEVTIVTGGWSGNEKVVSTIERTMFSFAYWQESHRGGLHKYQIHKDQWDKPWENGFSYPFPRCKWCRR